MVKIRTLDVAWKSAQVLGGVCGYEAAGSGRSRPCGGLELSEVIRADGYKISQAEIRRASGVVETTIIDDIDFIDVQPGQTMVIHNMILSDEQVTDASPDFQGPTIMAPAQEDLTAPQPSQQGHYTQTPNNGEIKVGNAMSTLTFSDQVDDKNKPTGAIQIDNTGPGDPETP